MLMLHTGSKEVSRERLSSFLAPEQTETWSPISHGVVAATIIRVARSQGYEIRKEKWGVMDGALYESIPGQKERNKVVVPGARMYGFLDFNPVPGLHVPGGMGLSMGIRTSFDKTFGQVLMFGGRVFICDNGVLVGEYEIKRKHTSGFNLDPLVDRAFQQMRGAADRLRDMHSSMTGRGLSDTEAKSLIVDLADAGAIKSGLVLPVYKEYRDPKHEDFRPRNAWSLYNATTEMMKGQSPSRQVEGFRALNEVLVPSLN